MKSPYVTIWNIPAKIGEIVAGALRTEIAAMCMDNYPAEEIGILADKLRDLEADLAEIKAEKEGDNESL